jgi:hypothetical protein
MLVFETTQGNREILLELETLTGNEISLIDSLDGHNIAQILIPLVSIVAPLISQTVQKFFNDNRVTIKYDDVEVSALGYDKAMKLLQAVLDQKQDLNTDDDVNDD